LDYTYWDGSQPWPNNGGYCAEMYGKGSFGHWHNKKCSDTYTAICNPEPTQETKDSFVWVASETCEYYGLEKIEDEATCRAAANIFVAAGTRGVKADYKFEVHNIGRSINQRPQGCTYHPYGNVELWPDQVQGTCDTGRFRCFCKKPDPQKYCKSDSVLDGIEFDEVTDSIGWVKIFSCEEARDETHGMAMNFYHDDIRLALQKAAISMKIVPEGSTKNPEYDEYAVEAKPMSNPVTAINNNLEASYVLDDDLERSDFANLDNWIGTDAAKARLSNSCGKNGNVESFEDKPYFACGNSRGLHIKKDGICRFDFGGNVGQNIEIYLGYNLPQVASESGLFGAKAVSGSSDSASPQSNSASSSSDEGANFIDFDPSSNSNPTASAISAANKNLLVLCLVVFNIGTILGCISCLFWSKQSRMTSAKVIYDGVHDFDEEEAQLRD